MLEIAKISPALTRDGILKAFGDIPFNPIACDTWHPTDNVPSVRFRIAHSPDAIFLHYEVAEPEMRMAASFDGDRVWEDSCVECFIAPDNDDFYYNFEFSAAGFVYINGGRPGDRIAPAPEVFASVKRWPEVPSAPSEDGFFHWSLVAMIPVTAFFRHRIGKLDGISCKANFYKCGDLLPRPHFLSWAPIDLPEPAFHCPKFFAPVRFVEK